MRQDLAVGRFFCGTFLAKIRPIQSYNQTAQNFATEPLPRKQKPTRVAQGT